MMKYYTMIMVALPFICLGMPACKSVESQKAAPTSSADKATQASTTSQPKNNDAAKPKQKTPKAKDFAARPFKITYVKKAATVGSPSQTTIELTPLAGYKMNTDFPTMMKIASSEGATAPTGTINPTKEAVTEAKISLSVDITPSKAGAIPINGTADFSVCNESTCKLFRKEQIAWQLDVN